MKLAKYLITMLLIALCFCMGGEIFQLYTATFTDKYCFIDVTLPEDDSALTVAKAAKSFGSEVFAAIKESSSPHSDLLRIYGTQGALSELRSDLGTNGGTAESLFSGATEIAFFDISELGADEAGVPFYFSADKSTVVDIRARLAGAGLGCSYVHKNAPSSYRWIFMGVWAAAAAFVLFMTWMDIQFQKKKAFVRISLGESVYAIILRGILLDLIVFTLIFNIEKAILSRFVFTGFRARFVLLLCLGALLVNSALYLTMARFDYKEVMYGANIRQSLLSDSYLIKAVLMLLIIISLSENVLLIKANYRFAEAYSKIDRLTDYESIKAVTESAFIPPEEYEASFEEEEAKENALALAERRLFLEAYSEDRVLLSVSFAELDEPILFINKAAVEALASDASFLKASDKDFVLYVPESKRETITEKDISFASGTCARILFGLRDHTCETIFYEHTEMIYFDLQNGAILANGFERLSDPIMVLCNVPGEKALLLAENEESPYRFGAPFWSICFSSSASSEPFEKCGFVKEVKRISVKEQCFENRSRIIRAVILGVTISAFLCVFCLLISGSAVRAEYMINSKRIALKKILGYGLVSRNRNTLVFNAVTVLAGLGIAVILAVVFKLAPIKTMLLCGAALLLTDLILVTVMMTRTEKKNTANILKGGCL